MNALAFSPDGTVLASGDANGVVWVRDIAGERPIGSSFVNTNALTGFSQPVSQLAFSPDGSLLAVASWGDIVLWDVAGRQFAGRLRGTCRTCWPWPSAPTAAGWPRAVRRATSRSGTWPSGGRRTLIGGSSERISALVFSPDGARLVAGGEAGSVEVWDLAGAAPFILGEWGATDQAIRAVALSEAGDWLTVLATGGEVSRWDIDEASWRQRACAVANRNLTDEEWRAYLGETQTYHETCPDLPAPPGAAADAATA